jgi:hypothetical protein
MDGNWLRSVRQWFRGNGKFRKYEVVARDSARDLKRRMAREIVERMGPNRGTALDGSTGAA